MIKTVQRCPVSSQVSWFSTSVNAKRFLCMFSIFSLNSNQTDYMCKFCSNSVLSKCGRINKFSLKNACCSRCTNFASWYCQFTDIHVCPRIFSTRCQVHRCKESLSSQWRKEWQDTVKSFWGKKTLKTVRQNKVHQQESDKEKVYFFFSC